MLTAAGAKGLNVQARVYVTLKRSVLDPQGKTIHSALEALGFRDVEGARCGKMIEVTFKAGVKPEAAERNLKDMCEKLLANTVIEDYRWEIV